MIFVGCSIDYPSIGFEFFDRVVRGSLRYNISDRVLGLLAPSFELISEFSIQLAILNSIHLVFVRKIAV